MMDYAAIRSELRGPAVLLMTPFRSDYSLNLDALRQNVRHVVDGGVSRGKGFIICPSGTGEYNTLSRDEHRSVVETAVEAARGDIPIVAGVASTSHVEVIERCRNAAAAGVSCAMIPPPYYYHGMTQKSVVSWYRIISEATDIGLMIYDQSWRNIGGTVDTPATEELAGIDSVVSIKRGALPNLKDYVESVERFSDRLAFVDNSYGYTAALAHMHGASSYITGLAAFWPEGEARFWSLLEAGRYADAERLHAKQWPFWEFVDGPFRGYATNVLKAAAEYAGIPAGSVRPPFADLTHGERGILHGILEKMGVRAAASVG